MKNSVSLNYKIYGVGKPLLILHGLFGSLDNWNSIASKISDWGFQVFNLDLRNHGHSPHTDLHNYDVMSDDVCAFIEQQKLNGVILLGHSMGAKAAMFVASKIPDLITKLVLVDKSPKHYPVTHSTIIDALLKVDFRKQTTRKEVENVLEPYINDWSTRQFLMKGLYWKDKDELAWRFNLVAIRNQVEEVGEAFNPQTPLMMPTLFIAGSKSDYISNKDHLTISKSFNDFRIVPIKDAGHWVHAENPVDFLRVLEDFIV
ncbi:MAG TPA: alpha/beta fold hydrolase [Bacteroidia bacterium]|nr:alpha/beta fold hydrolase [Bacteroidia bacterium]